ncbi:MAG: fumarylacetoacetate hydrolase family protein [Gemmatimonadota bacterium]|nr:fumarylacetoacetate hydrolase family protein [Gemmatimonadota bacterium]
MRFVRFAYGDVVAYGEERGDVVHEWTAAPFWGGSATGRTFDRADVRLLAPCEPSKVLAVGRNFASHLHGREAPREPGLFAKMPTSIIGPGDPIVLPPDSQDVHFEGELVVVIGRRTRSVTPEEAGGCVFGVTCGNDVSERVWQRGDLQWLRAKGSDSFGPLGPAIETGLDHADLNIQTRLNGQTMQAESSADLIFPVEEVISFASQYVTLDPGDVVYLGTPGSTSAMSPGDVVEIEVDGVGVLTNRVVAG